MDPTAAARRGFDLPRARVDLAALVANCRRAAEVSSGARVMAVVKADAYGHGAGEVARALTGVADALAVARVAEGLELRKAGIDAPIVVLQGCLASGELESAVDCGLEVVVHREDQLVKLLGGRQAENRRVWLKIDTGMHRLGFAPAGFAQAFEALRTAPGVAEVVAMSHLACADDPADDFNAIQLERFRSVTSDLGAPRSLANSGALLASAATHFDWVRPGIMLYGASPFGAADPAGEGLRPVMSLESEVIAVRDLASGEGIGYGQRFVCERPTRVGVVAAGYGDGYPRHAPDGTPVSIAGHRTRLIGRVSMDSLTVDLSKLPGISVGARAELWGEEVSVGEVAAACGTIAYELLTRVPPRVPRHYST